MASIINQTYFGEDKAELRLPIDNIPTQSYIDKHEKIILKLLLGYELYKEFVTALAGTPAQKWIDLRDGKDYTDSNGDLQEYEGIQQIIADYVFVQIVADKQSSAKDSGVKVNITDNAERAVPRYKQVWADGDMHNRRFFLDEFIDATNDETADTYDNYLPSVIGKGNIFNI